MRGKIILVLVGLAALSVLFIFPPDENAWRPYSQPSAVLWEVFWLTVFFRDSWGGGPTDFSKNKVATLSIAAIGTVVFLTGVALSDIRLAIIGIPMAGFSICAILWWEYRKGVKRKAGKSDVALSFTPISLEAIFLRSNPELKLIIQEVNNAHWVRDVMQPFLSILLSAPQTLKRDALLTNLYAGIECVMESQDDEAKQSVLQELFLGKGSWWWGTSQPFMGDATQKALELETPGWRELQVGAMPGCFPYPDYFGLVELLDA